MTWKQQWMGLKVRAARVGSQIKKVHCLPYGKECVYSSTNKSLQKKRILSRPLFWRTTDFKCIVNIHNMKRISKSLDINKKISFGFSSIFVKADGFSLPYEKIGEERVELIINNHLKWSLQNWFVISHSSEAPKLSRAGHSSWPESRYDTRCITWTMALLQRVMIFQWLFDHWIRTFAWLQKAQLREAAERKPGWFSIRTEKTMTAVITVGWRACISHPDCSVDTFIRDLPVFIWQAQVEVKTNIGREEDGN